MRGESGRGELPLISFRELTDIQHRCNIAMVLARSTTSEIALDQGGVNGVLTNIGELVEDSSGRRCAMN